MNKIRILIVADEEDILNSIRNICQEYDVTVETSSQKAAEIIKYEKFDIFIIDYQMSGMNGIELLQKIRELYEEDSYIPVFCTASGTLDLFRQEQYEMLFHYFIEKPIDLGLAKGVLRKAVLSARIRRYRR